jgi:hypothetical protein
MRRYIAAVLALVAAALVALPAAADGWHRGSRTSFSFYYGAPLYHRHYYGPPVVMYAPPPVVVYRAAPGYYAPPPATFYTPPPAYAQAPVDAMPASPVYTDSYGRQCREFQSTVTVGGAPQPSFGTACLQPDGSWRIVP